MSTSTSPSCDPVSRRLDHLADLCAKGLVASAELELQTWRREADCPPAATALLAALLAQRGRPDDACRLLNGLHDEPDERLDAHQAALLVAILAERGQHDAADRLAGRLTHAHAHDPAIRGYLGTMGFEDAAESPSAREVAELTEAIAARPALLSAMVSAAVSDDGLTPADRATLASAGRRVHDQLESVDDRAAVALGMAHLALAEGYQDDARRWGHVGLRDAPDHAGLALLMAELDDDPRHGPPARLALARALRRHPHYPDLRAAYIRRCRRDGRTDSARRRLSAWLRRDPRSPVAIALREESLA